MKSNDSVIVSWDFTNGQDEGILLVGHKTEKGPVKVINAFQGKEAEEVHKLLTTVRTKSDNGD